MNITIVEERVGSGEYSPVQEAKFRRDMKESLAQRVPSAPLYVLPMSFPAGSVDFEVCFSNR